MFKAKLQNFYGTAYLHISEKWQIQYSTLLTCLLRSAEFFLRN